MDDLHVDGHLAAIVGNDKDANAATARLESLLEAAPERALVDDGQVLLDVTGLGHGDDTAILHVKDTVLLEDRAEHGLDDDAGGRVGDERRLLMELLGEEVDTKVAVLASGSGGGDADDLAGAALEDEDVTEADVVAGNGHGVGLVGTLRGRGGTAAGLANLTELNTVMGLRGQHTVSNTISKLMKSPTERVVVAWRVRCEYTTWYTCRCLKQKSRLTVLVVVTHLGFGNGGRSVTGCVNGLFGDLDVRLVEDGARASGVDGGLSHADRLLVDGKVAGSVDGSLVDVDGLLEGGAVDRDVDGGTNFLTVVGLETRTVFTLSKVDHRVVGLVRLVEFNARLGISRVRSEGEQGSGQLKFFFSAGVRRSVDSPARS